MKVGVEKKFDERDCTLRLLAIFLNIIFFFKCIKKQFFVKFALFNPKNKNEPVNRFFEFSREELLLHLLHKKKFRGVLFFVWEIS